MCHVLIIEDEPMIAMLIQDALEEAGATSFAFAGTEQDAVDLALEHRPAFITSDVRLIDGTGPRAVAAILAKVGEIPVLFITGTPQECEPCGPNALVLMKPINFMQVRTAFQQIAKH